MTSSPRRCSAISPSTVTSWSSTTSAPAAFEPLRFVPAGKHVVLGLVTTKSPVLEDRGHAQAPDRARPRSTSTSISSASRRQCGFSSTEEGNKLTIDEERAKLELIVQVAEDVWGR